MSAILGYNFNLYEVKFSDNTVISLIARDENHAKALASSYLPGSLSIESTNLVESDWMPI